MSLTTNFASILNYNVLFIIKAKRRQSRINILSTARTRDRIQETLHPHSSVLLSRKYNEKRFCSLSCHLYVTLTLKTVALYGVRHRLLAQC